MTNPCPTCGQPLELPTEILLTCSGRHGPAAPPTDLSVCPVCRARTTSVTHRSKCEGSTHDD
jgi:hypothetical protein